MPRYFMSETRWAGFERMMMDSSRSVPRPKTKQKRPQKKLPCNRPVKPQPPKPTNEEAGV